MKKIFGVTLLVGALAACTQGGLGSGPSNARFEGNTSASTGYMGTLVNAAGMTLYTFDRDVAGSGKSVCNGQCAANWPPHAAKATDMDSGNWSVIKRDDGSYQWAFQGKPVYTYVKDQKPGDVTGDGFNNAWRIVRR